MQSHAAPAPLRGRPGRLALVVTGASAQTKDWSTSRSRPKALTSRGISPTQRQADRLRNRPRRGPVQADEGQCEIVAQAFDGVIPALNAGKFDAIMAGMNITDKRKEAIVFTQPYGRTPSTFAVLKSMPLAKLPEAGKVFSLNPDGLAAAREIDQRHQADAQGQGDRRADLDRAGQLPREVLQGRDRDPPVQDDGAARSRPCRRPRRRRVRLDLVPERRGRGAGEQGNDARRARVMAAVLSASASRSACARAIPSCRRSSTQRSARRSPTAR